MGTYFLSSNTKINNTGNKPPIITEPDGSIWLQIFHHNNPGNSVFNTQDYFAGSFRLSEDLWFNMSACNSFTKWEILVKQRQTPSSTEEKYRWIQNANPMTCAFEDVDAADVTFITTSGYTAPGATYGGFYVKNGYTYISANNGTAGNWWGAVGAFQNYQNGIPAYNAHVVTTGYFDVYIRIDNDSITSANLKALLDTDITVLKTGNRAWHYNRWPSFSLSSSNLVYGTTGTVTTCGRPVFITLSGDLNAPSEASSAFIEISRGVSGSGTHTQIADVMVNSQGGSINVPFCVSVLDPVPAGSWSYYCSITWASGTPNFGEGSDNNAPVVTIMEI